MPAKTTIFTTIRTEGALLPADLPQRISEGATLDGLTPESYHHPGEKLNEAINRAWNALQGVWASFRAAQERLPESDLGTSVTRERWLLPLFRELDYGRLQSAPAYEIAGRTYPISHTWEQVPIHLVSYKVDLDTRTRGVAGAATASPHSLVQVFLNRSDGNLWGFLSNGYKLRILRDNVTLTRQAYVEFDLEAMMDGEVYSDFVLLWLLCHQSRVEGAKPSECWLEKWMKVAEDQGTRALDQLRDGVEAAITALGLGFLEHPANATLREQLAQTGGLSGQDYYRQLLRLVYRLLFLFVAEDRDLLLQPNPDNDPALTAARDRYRQYYSTQRLRQMAETFKGTRHPDLFEALRLVMRLLSGDSPADGTRLALVPLGSFLFSDGAVQAVIDCQISNQHLLDAIRALSLTYDARAQVYRSIDYRNLGPEELGSIYESLLELHPQINVPARTFALATAGGNERKTTGSYYTPTSLINALLDSALDPVLEEAIKGKPHPPTPSPSGEGETSAEQRILNLKICDPACGSGHFLIAAAGRMAKKLAEIRTQEEEPPPSAIQAAKRDIIGHCIYGVDINPMAVELCKVNLWMEALEPGKPLSFLDHRILVGNSLLGTTPALMAGGIPDDAFNPIEGDDKSDAAWLKKLNRQERKERERLANGQQDFLDLVEPPANYRAISAAARGLDRMDDDTLDGLRRKEQAYTALEDDPERQKAQILADAWCAAFVWDKGASNQLPPMSDLQYRQLEKDPLAPRYKKVLDYLHELKRRYQFFHWHVAFPDVFVVPEDVKGADNAQMGWNGGFDCVLGNPPWERIKIQEKEWFAQCMPEIAAAPNAAARKRMIDALKNHPTGKEVWADFQADLRQAEGESHFVRISERYPLAGHGDVNTYTIFTETARNVINGSGYLGIIVPSGIATDDTTKFFFQDLIQAGSLVSLYDFENRENIFNGIGHGRFKFCLLTIAGRNIPRTSGADFVFFALNSNELKDDNKRFTLSAHDIRLLNPNTGTTATFRTKRDASITKSIFRLIPILLQEDPLVNPWAISFLRMFDMTSDSGSFRTREELENKGWQLRGTHFLGDRDVYLPLYEAKMMHQYNHRYGDYQDYPEGALTSILPDVPATRLAVASYSILPKYWIELELVQRKLENHPYSWLVGFRDIARPTDERTAIFACLPLVGAGNKIPILLSEHNLTPLIANSSSFIFDFVVRQKVGGTSLNFFYVKQFPALPPHTYTPELLAFIVPRVLELTYTAWDLQAFARDLSYEGAPFVWDEDRRFVMRCELDALYFHLYGINREDAEYILETFPIVKRKDIAAHGEYRTKRVIMEMYEQMAALPTLTVPAPKDERATYPVPDVSLWSPWLNPPPGDPRAAHPLPTA